jgi:hypothetical protein
MKDLEGFNFIARDKKINNIVAMTKVFAGNFLSKNTPEITIKSEQTKISNLFFTLYLASCRI